MSELDEVVRLKLDGNEVPIAVDYRVDAGVLTIPAAFEMTVGHAGLIAELASAFPPVTPFELYVGDVKVQTGETDVFQVAGSLGSVVRLTGRDMLKWLVDTQVRNERTFAEKTYFQLVDLALSEVGLEGTLISEDNTANLKAITGVQSIQQLAPVTTEGTETEVGQPGPTRIVYRTVNAEVGSTWWDFISEQLRRAGLFLWADIFGGFVLTKPNGLRVPISRIVRRRDRAGEPGAVNVLGPPDFSHDVTQRYTECQVFGRGGGGVAGRTKLEARHFDDEMIALLNRDPANRANGGKRQKPLIIKDDKVRTIEAARFLARRKIAESRRNGWRLAYSVPGHTTPALNGGGRAVWQPDTVVEVDDEELGIKGPMYIESVTYRRKPETTTELRLLRIEDLIFAEEDVTAQKAGRRPGLQKVRAGVATIPEVTIESSPLDTTRFWRKDPNFNSDSPGRTSFVRNQ